MNRDAWGPRPRTQRPPAGWPGATAPMRRPPLPPPPRRRWWCEIHSWRDAGWAGATVLGAVLTALVIAVVIAVAEFDAALFAYLLKAG